MNTLLKTNKETDLNLLISEVKIRMSCGENILICVAGGSGSSKSTLAKKLAVLLGSDDCLVLHQDHFMNQRLYQANRESSIYRWDDPGNFLQDGFCDKLNQLVFGREVDIQHYCAYDTLIDGTVTIQPKPIIILEGIYSFYDDEINNLDGVKVYLKDYVFNRIIKRLIRSASVSNSYDQSKTLEYLITSIYLAHNECVSTQIQYSDFIFYSPFDSSYYNNLINNSREVLLTFGGEPVDRIDLIQDKVYFNLRFIRDRNELWFVYKDIEIRICHCSKNDFDRLKEFKLTELN